MILKLVVKYLKNVVNWLGREAVKQVQNKHTELSKAETEFHEYLLSQWIKIKDFVRSFC